ncbi:uncharacterized protein LOC108630399 [Ceratina calcarata]|uniref:Uncharacterized protein LOC108630399 n=1 Tax=Ceratina calcarata TaxID=156304 RepID=A0AAJ7NCY1_9HYME|nr:uncharacterized protein LOC108630399 [Ceratina calcarata]
MTCLAMDREIGESHPSTCTAGTAEPKDTMGKPAGKRAEKPVEAPAARIKIKVAELKEEIGEFLIDGGSAVNLVDYDALRKPVEFTTRERLTITGLAPATVHTIGTVKIHINSAPALFHVLKNFPLPISGIIGSPFLLQEEAEISYHHKTLVTQKECLAMVYAVQYFRPYVYGRKFTLVTDHRPLVWLHSVKDPTSRLVKWKLKLLEYDYKVIHKAGKTNKNADALSRNPTQICLPLIPREDKDYRPNAPLKSADGTTIGQRVKSLRRNRADPMYAECSSSDEAPLRDTIITKKKPPRSIRERNTRDSPQNKSLLPSLNREKDLPDEQPEEELIPIARSTPINSPNLNKSILSYTMNDGPPIAGDLISFEEDNANSTLKPTEITVLETPAPAISLPAPLRPSLSDQAPLTPQVAPSPTPPEENSQPFRPHDSIAIFEESSDETDHPKDNDSLFITPPEKDRYRPQTNESLERSNIVLTEYLKHYLNTYEDWDLLIPFAVFSYNTSIHEATKHTPYELIFGRPARIPSSFPNDKNLQTYDSYVRELTSRLTEIRKIAAVNLNQAKERSKRYYDRRLRPKEFKIGQYVYVQKEPRIHKFDPHYIGPYRIIDKTNNHNVVLQTDTHKIITKHEDKLKQAYLSKDSSDTD